MDFPDLMHLDDVGYLHTREVDSNLLIENYVSDITVNRMLSNNCSAITHRA